MPLSALSSRLVRPLHVFVDSALLLVAWWLAFWLRFNLDMPAEFMPVAWVSASWMLAANLVILIVGNVYRQVWRFVSLSELRQLGVCVAIAGATSAALVLMQRYEAFPRTVLVLHPLLAFLFLGGVRAAWRMQTERGFPAVAQMRPLLIIGSLGDAVAALRALKGSHLWQPVGILTPQPEDRGRWLQNVPVLGTVEMIAEAGQLAGASTALVASPPGSPQRREALLKASGSGVTLLTMRSADEWLQQDSAEPRKVEIDDLLGRDPVQLDVAGLAELFSGQTVLVTGAGGSIGSELCRQVSRFGVGKLVCLDVSEYAIYQLEQELRAVNPRMQGIYYTANVREADRLRAIALRHRPAVVFHAAAYKHVPLMEELNEIEALRTNVLGTLHAARVAGECGARRFVMISTDKAVNPTNIMGSSKRLAELMVQGVAAEFAGTRYVSVRFGNVLGSSGSVVPLFAGQIARGGPVTVTHPEIVRYFMTIPEAAQLVLQAGLMGHSGQIFVLDMGEPMKIVELARMLIRLSGKTEQDIPITYTGLRPGEKLFEELLADDETTEPTPHPKLRVAKTNGQLPDIDAVMRWIGEAGPAPARDDLRRWLRGQVPEYAAR
ncbi:MAG: polysaccharide biosynthesis protein [Ramlibacter sp.]|nr:polysaccharide biosynthesis protein [Ramlibacter sp.]